MDGYKNIRTAFRVKEREGKNMCRICSCTRAIDINKTRRTRHARHIYTGHREPGVDSKRNTKYENIEKT